MRRTLLIALLLLGALAPSTASAAASPGHRRAQQRTHRRSRVHHARRHALAARAAGSRPAGARTSAGARTASVPTPAARTAVALWPLPLVTGTTYYVSPAGSDSSSGLSPAQAWRTVDRVNRAHLNPGDAVLFQGGQTFADAVLQPSASGAPGHPVIFGSYGSGSATITQGAWFVASHLAFERLAFGATFYGGSEVHGQSDDVLLDHVVIVPPAGNTTLGLYTNGNGWSVQNSVIADTGLSGMLLNGDHYLIADDTIAHTGLDTNAGYNSHGIYLDASNATIAGNSITDFSESGVSVRYRNSTITGNQIARGNIGIDYFQSDTVAGHAVWQANTITGTTAAGVYVSPSGSGGSTMESFTITGNTLRPAAGVFLNLHPTTGTYTVSANGLL
jgi:hypothetical protein